MHRHEKRWSPGNTARMMNRTGVVNNGRQHPDVSLGSHVF